MSYYFICSMNALLWPGIKDMWLLKLSIIDSFGSDQELSESWSGGLDELG